MTEWLAGFERITTKASRYIPELDGMRCVAILAVVIFHISFYIVNKVPQVGTLAQHDQIKHYAFLGSLGVELFFVISGFILSQPFLKHNGRVPNQLIRSYYLRRVTRLEPPYIIAMVAIYIGLFAKQGYGNAMHLLPNFLASLAYVHNVVLGEKSLINPVAWSLEIEIQFYLVMPLLLSLLGSAWTKRRVILAGVATGFAIINCVWSPQIVTLPNFFQYLLVGILWADLYNSGDLQRSRLYNSHVADNIAIAAVIVWLVVYNYGSTWIFNLFTTVVISACFGAALSGRYLLRLLRSDYVRILGTMCYSVYLLHYMLTPLFGPLALRVGLGLTRGLLPLVGVSIVIVGTASVICAAVFYRAIERPCMNSAWPSKVWNYLVARTFGVGARDMA